MKYAQVELRRGARDCLMVNHAVGPAPDKVIGVDLGHPGGEFREWRRSDGDCATGGGRKFGDEGRKSDPGPSVGGCLYGSHKLLGL